MGGVILDLGKTVFSVPLIAYSLVFFMQAVGMLLAILILDRVDVKEFQDNTRKALSTVMEGDLD